MAPGKSMNTKYTISSEGQVSVSASPPQGQRTVFTDKSAAEGQTYTEWYRVVRDLPQIRSFITIGWMNIVLSLFLLFPANVAAYMYFNKRLLYVARLWKPNKNKAGLVRVKAIYQGDTSIFFRTAYEIALRGRNLFAVRSVRFQGCKCLVLIIKGGYESLALSQVNVTLNMADDGKNEVRITGRKRFLAPWEDKDKLDTPTRLLMKELVEGLSSQLSGLTLQDVPEVVLAAKSEIALKKDKSSLGVLSNLGISIAPREQTQLFRKALVWVLLRAELIYLLVSGCEIMLIWILIRLIFKT
jgi:hypothetical protein